MWHYLTSICCSRKGAFASAEAPGITTSIHPLTCYFAEPPRSTAPSDRRDSDRDGAEGLVAVKQHGGVTLVRNPREALFAELPRIALARVEVDYAASLSSIASRLIDLGGLI